MVFLKKHDIITAVYYFPPRFSLFFSLTHFFFLVAQNGCLFHKRLQRWWMSGGVRVTSDLWMTVL